MNRPGDGTARDHVLANIRARLGRPAQHGAHADARLREHPSGPIPARARGSASELRGRFVEMARRASADVEELGGLAALPGVVARIGGEHGFVAQAVAAPDSAFDALDWSAAGVAITRGAAGPDDRICISPALCGVAETGTVVLRSGPDSPVTLGFLPDVHVIALDAERIVGSYEQVWEWLRALGTPPRAVNWITGPSRSADIEQTIQLGAHGPMRLVLALY